MNRTPLLVLGSALCLPVAALAQPPGTPFDAPVVQFGPNSPAMQRLFDFDGDGDLDAVGGRVAVSCSGFPCTATNWDTRVWSNDGAGRFQVYMQENGGALPTGSNPQGLPIAVGDMNGDGFDDFAQAAGSEIWRYYAPGPGGIFFSKAVENVGVPIRALAVADFDGDGAADVGVLTNSTVEVHWAAGGATAVPYAGLVGASDRLVVMDTDGDPLPDLLLVMGWEMRPFTVGAASITPGSSMAYVSYGPMVDAGDIDADGDEDIVAFFPPTFSAPAQVEIHRRTGATTWVQE
ncbi:MAG TPA: VCBS repeat-containing protein, partial [Planctomycetota bacterium]|nr:VCBS repeat-containing protein [Planctomycetota bacterium]